MSIEEVDAANKLIIDSITKYKVIVAGCRDFDNYELLKEKCDYFLQDEKKEDVVIISGHASGADALIAFWDGKSRGTKNMIDTATKRGLQVAVVRY